MDLSMATHNPSAFQAGISASAGFCRSQPRAGSNAPKLFLEHGAQDGMFPLARVGLPLKEQLAKAGYPIEHYVAPHGGHMWQLQGWQDHFLLEWLAMGAHASSEVATGVAVRIKGLQRMTKSKR